MKAVVCQNKTLRVDEIAEPIPQTGHAVIDVHHCGICGSDLHAREHCNHLSETVRQVGYERFMTSEQEVVMGHEFCGEILDYGPDSKQLFKPGTRVCALPFIKYEDGFDLHGFSERSNGAYAERMLVDEMLTVEITNGLPSEEAALTEPMAIGLHAVNRSEIKKDDAAIIIGCGPIGLSIIANLKTRGVKHIIASDFSPARRQLALTCGATKVVDPAKESPYDSWEEFGHSVTVEQTLGLAHDARGLLGKLPIPWWQAWRLAEWLGKASPKRPIIYECVGIPGMINQILGAAPFFSRVIVVGVCMESDKFEPTMAINKEIDLRFVVGYTPLEFRDTLHLLCEGKLNAKPLITGHVGLDGIANAFEELAHPDKHAKILINPKLSKANP